MVSRNRLLRGIKVERGGAGVVLLLLITIAFAVAVVLAYLKMKKQEADMQALRDQLEKATVAAPAVITPKVEGEKEVQAKREIEKKAGELGAKLSEVEKAKIAAEQKVGAVAKEKDELIAQVKDLGEKVKELTGTNKLLEKDMAEARSITDKAKTVTQAKEVELADALARLDKVEGALEEMKLTLAKAQKDADATARKLVEEIEQKELKVGELMAALNEYPTAPLAEDAAKPKYDKLVEQANAAQERSEKIALLFKGTLMLKGTSYESKLAQQLSTEQKALQADREKLATELNKQANDKIKASPEAYDENIAFLTEALEKAKGTKMEKSIQKLLDQQKVKAEAAKKTAEAEAAKKAAEGAAPVEGTVPAEEAPANP